MKYFRIGIICLIISILVFITQKECISQPSLDEILRRVRTDNVIIPDDLDRSQVIFMAYELKLLDLVNEMKDDILSHPDIIDSEVLTCGVILSLAKEIPQYAHLDIHRWIDENLGIDLNQPQMNAIDAVTDALLEENVKILDEIEEWMKEPSRAIRTRGAIQRVKITIEQQIEIVEVFYDRAINDDSSYVRFVALTCLKNTIPKKYWQGYDSGEVTLEQVVNKYIEDLRRQHGL